MTSSSSRTGAVASDQLCMCRLVLSGRLLHLLQCDYYCVPTWPHGGLAVPFLTIVVARSVFSPIGDPNKSGPTTDPKTLAGYQGANRGAPHEACFASLHLMPLMLPCRTLMIAVNQGGELAGTNQQWERGQRRKSRGGKRGGGSTREV